MDVYAFHPINIPFSCLSILKNLFFVQKGRYARCAQRALVDFSHTRRRKNAHPHGNKKAGCFLTHMNTHKFTTKLHGKKDAQY